MPRKPMPWFRFYVEAVHDRKLRRLKPETRWLFVVCLSAARQSPEPGWLLVGEDDPMDLVDLVDFAHMTRSQVERGMDRLQNDAKVVAFDQTRKAWFIPNWDKRQYESDVSTTRTRKHRSKQEESDEGTTLERSQDVSRNGTERARERLRSVTETENRIQRQKQTSNPSPASLARSGLRLAVGGGFR